MSTKTDYLLNMLNYMKRSIRAIRKVYSDDYIPEKGERKIPEDRKEAIKKSSRSFHDLVRLVEEYDRKTR